EYIAIVDTLKENEYVHKVLPFFERGNAPPIGTSDFFYIKLKGAEDTIQLRQIAEGQNVQIVKQVPYMPLWYILTIRNSTLNNSIDATNYFYETGYFEDVDPAFMFNFRTNCTNDPLFSQLWGLKNNTYSGIDINVCNAWKITRGAGVNVAVVDQGIDPNHNDLLANFHSLSFNAQSGTSPSVFTGASHGTHVAGTIAAIRNNNLQVVGVSPESKIMRISHSLSVSSTASAELASGISWAWQNGADVINNSWGDQGGYYFNQLQSSILDNAIVNAIKQGRQSKGSVVVFASGNFSPVMDYPANSNNDILTVGSVNPNGVRSSFSGYGAKLDVVAPGNDIISTLPYNSIGSMDGTSMAAPHVAGVAALVLSVNPNLSWQQVKYIIETTAQKVRTDLYTYANNPSRPSGTWNDQVGHGLVNAYEAVCLASCTAVANFTNQTVNANQTVTNCFINANNVTVTNNAKLILNAVFETTITGPFEVQLGSELEIKFYKPAICPAIIIKKEAE
ncbi:MAG: S8 family serine peptidase, partial [Firmicutes bacterium]|nr:S8 family serine peptidase [Bacillota bacterium]